jgi:hypothetical protein
MVAVNDLSHKLDRLLQFDISAMYEYGTNTSNTQVEYDACVDYICEKMSFNQPRKKFCISEKCYASERHLHDTELDCPLFNPICLIKEEIAKDFGVCYQKLWENLFSLTDFINSVHLLQLGMSIAMQHVSKNMGVFDAGINILPHLLTHDRFANFQNVYLLHCCVNSYTRIKDLCDYYLNETDFLGYEHYYDTTKKFHESMTNDIQRYNNHYKQLNIRCCDD